MKKTVSLLLVLLLNAAALTACGAQKQDLVSKTPFPEFSETDTQGNPITDDIFEDYDITIVNFWNNGCGTCIAEMPELEEMYQEFQKDKINLIGVGADCGESEEQLQLARSILEEKGSPIKTSFPIRKMIFIRNLLPILPAIPLPMWWITKGTSLERP